MSAAQSPSANGPNPAGASLNLPESWDADPPQAGSSAARPQPSSESQAPGALWLDEIGPPRRMPSAAALRAEQKAATRSKVRRHSAQQAEGGSAEAATPPEALVLVAETASRDQLGDHLREFGFMVRSLADPAEAFALAATRRFAAIFVDFGLDGNDLGDSIDLCKHMRQLQRRSGGSTSVLVLVATRFRPIDRVRAELAGCDEIVHKPISRGLVARVLDARGVALPRDRRRL